MTRISIIMPLYNKAPYVRWSLEHVAAQTYRDWELIIVDDGSTDHSVDVVKTWLVGQNDLRQQVRLLQQENAGVGTARNRGVQEANGEYLCFLDADDWWHPDFLKEMADMMERFPDAGICGCNYFYVKNRTARPMRQDVALAEGEAGYVNYCQAYGKGLIMPLSSISVCMPKSVFESMGGFRPHLKLGEDFDLWIRIALSHKVAFLNKPLAYYNQDMPASHRATRNLHRPEHHVLFNVGYLEPEEAKNADYKYLIDRLRATSLLDYWLCDAYREQARKELDKVDWSKQSPALRKKYDVPIWRMKAERCLMRCGSRVKQWCLSHLKK